MQVRNIPIIKIKVPEVRVTAVYDAELTEQLRTSLEAAGQLQPILVVQTEEGYELVDGLHRLQEAQRRGDATLPGVVVKGDSITAMLFNLVTNRMRGKTKASEMVKVIDELVHTHQMDSVQIQEKTGFTRDYIERLWKISEAHSTVRDALDAELIGVGVAFEVSRLPSPLQQEAVMQTVATYRMTTQQVRQTVDEVLSEMSRPAETPPQQPIAIVPAPAPPACEVCRQEHELLTQVVLGPRCYGHLAYMIAQERQQAAPAAPPDEAASP